MSGIIAQNAGRHTGLVKASSAGGVWTLIKTVTASASADITFVHGTSDVVLDSTYDEYVFKLINLHTANGDVNMNLTFRDGGTNYDAVKTTAAFQAFHSEGDSTEFGYNVHLDLAEATGNQSIGYNLGNGNDESLSGEMRLFAPSDTTFVKHFISTTVMYEDSDGVRNIFVAGYCNTTSAIDGVQFKPYSGNIDAGSISLYGIT